MTPLTIIDIEYSPGTWADGTVGAWIVYFPGDVRDGSNVMFRTCEEALTKAKEWSDQA